MQDRHRAFRILSVAALFVLSSGGVTGSARAEGSPWQERMLFSPSAQQLAMEARGRVMIYDGLTDRQVDRALNSQFERIDRMMFVRTIQTDATGEAARDPKGALIVSDDC